MKEKVNKILKSVMVYIFVFIILISSYMILQTLSSLIPSSYLERNVTKSSETLLENNEILKIDLKYKEESLFVFTDALMINTVYSVDNKNPIESFMLARKNYILGQTKKVYIDSQYNLGANPKYINKKTGDLYQTKELYALMHGENIEDSYEYARYWHGYLTILRPLLAIFDYSAIRVILFVITLICVISMLILIGKKINVISAIIYGIGLLSISIFIVSQSINEILIFLVAFISTIILLLRYKKIKRIGLFFFVVGSIASFIDLLTAPLVTLGLLAITYFLLLQKDEENLNWKVYIIELLKIGIMWFLGYGITWASKWIITEIFFNRPIISQSIEQVLFRINQSENVTRKITFKRVMDRNMSFLSSPVTTTILGISMIYAITMLIKNWNTKVDFKQNAKRCIPYTLIFFFPLVWYLVLKEHSYTHAFFVYRNLILSIISFMLVLNKIFEIKKDEQVK